MQFDDFFTRYASLGFEVQQHVAMVVAGHEVSADLDRQRIAFDGLGEFRAELIGTESGPGGAWLWGWANPSGFPSGLTERVATLPELTQHMPGFAEPETPLGERFDGHRASILTLYLLGFKGYVGLSNGDGTAYLGIADPLFEVDQRPDLQRFVSAITHVIGQFTIADHLTMVETHARVRRFGVEVDGPDAVTVSGDGGEATVSFDDRRRITGIDAKLGAGPPTPERQRRTWFGRRRR